MTGDQAAARARRLFLDEWHVYGCAETTLMVLKEAFELPEPADASPAMALNGGVAYSGGVCGAITGAAVAVGMLAERRLGDHALAKRTARPVVARLIEEFERRFGAADCRTLLGREIRTPEQHRAFLNSGVWCSACMGQVSFAVRSLSGLASDPMWIRESPAEPVPVTGPRRRPARAGLGSHRGDR